MLDDVMFDAGIALSLEVLSTRISSPIYQYIFSYEAPFGMIKSLMQVENGELQVVSVGNLQSLCIAMTHYATEEGMW